MRHELTISCSKGNLVVIRQFMSESLDKYDIEE
ncbi:MAG: hypothetical protein ACI8QD_002610, partial [Cyclobacteriaceae bacterium]